METPLSFNCRPCAADVPADAAAAAHTALHMLLPPNTVAAEAGALALLLLLLTLAEYSLRSGG